MNKIFSSNYIQGGPIGDQVQYFGYYWNLKKKFNTKMVETVKIELLLYIQDYALVK